jgi:hypothetical protein
MSTTFTLAELLNQAAFKVGALAVGQALSAEDQSIFSRYASSLFDQLAEDDILMIADTGNIPASWSPYLASLVANLAGPDYGMPFSADAKQLNESILRRLVRGAITFEQQTPEYF